MEFIGKEAGAYWAYPPLAPHNSKVAVRVSEVKSANTWQLSETEVEHQGMGAHDLHWAKRVPCAVETRYKAVGVRLRRLERPFAPPGAGKPFVEWQLVSKSNSLRGEDHPSDDSRLPCNPPGARLIHQQLGFDVSYAVPASPPTVVDELHIEEIVLYIGWEQLRRTGYSTHFRTYCDVDIVEDDGGQLLLCPWGDPPSNRSS